MADMTTKAAQVQSLGWEDYQSAVGDMLKAEHIYFHDMFWEVEAPPEHDDDPVYQAWQGGKSIQEGVKAYIEDYIRLSDYPADDWEGFVLDALEEVEPSLVESAVGARSGRFGEVCVYGFSRYAGGHPELVARDFADRCVTGNWERIGR